MSGENRVFAKNGAGEGSQTSSNLQKLKETTVLSTKANYHNRVFHKDKTQTDCIDL